MYGDVGNFWVGMFRGMVYERSQARDCNMWTRHADGKLYPKHWEKGFETQREAFEYLDQRGDFND